MAAREILLRFGTRTLQEAERVAKSIRDNALEALKTIKDVNLRRQAAKAARDEFAEAKAGIRAEQKRERLGARAGALVGREVFDGREFVARAITPFNAAREKIPTFIRAGQSVSSLGSGISALGEGVSGVLPGIGPIGAVAGAVVGIVIPIMERKLAVQEAALAARFSSEIEERLFRADVKRRLEEDTAFAREQARLALAQETAYRAHGYVRRHEAMGVF